MRHTAAVLAIGAALWAAGCTSPAPVELQQEAATVEATQIENVGGDLDLASIDSSGITPAEQLRVSGRMQVTEVRMDNGQGVRRFVLGSVLFQDLRLPVVIGGRTFGYYGLPVRSLALDGVPMVRVPHAVRVRGFVRDTVHAGVEYLQDLTATYTPGHLYVWGVRATALSDSVTIPVTAPGPLTVLAPAGGTSVPRGMDLRLRWNAAGRVHVIVSAVDPQTGRPKPRVQLTVPAGTTEAVVPARLLSGFPAGPYAFTFVQANRFELPTLTDPQGKVLVQAATLYTVFVALR